MPVYLSCKANPLLISEFDDVRLVYKNAPVYEAISAHPDIYMCRMPDGSSVKAEEGEIGSKYPYDIAFNAVCLERYFIHNLKYTNPGLKKAAEKFGLTPVNVKQGYTKCSCVVVDGRSVITADEGIYAALSAINGVSVLKVRSGGVRLKGFDSGFLGGASGRVGGTVYFAGNISEHPDWDMISAFITERGLKIKGFPFPLEDIGSIIESSN